MIGDTFLEQFASKYRWITAPVKRRFQYRKDINKGMRETHRMALTMRGVIDRSLDDLEGLQASDYSTYQIFEQGDIAFKLIDLENIKTSRVGLVPRRGIMSSAYIRLMPTSPDVDSRFYSWFFFAVYFNNIFNGMGGGVRQNLTSTDLLEFPIPFPDLSTQRTIADFLGRETARIDSLIKKKQRLVELLGEKRSALITTAVTGNNSSAPENSGGGNRNPVEEGDRVTTHRLRDVALVITSNVDKVIDPGEHTIRLCNYVDVYKNNFIRHDLPFNVGSATALEIKNFKLRVDDVVITKDSESRDDIGVPALVTSTSDDLVCGYHLSILRANRRGLIGPFLYWHLLSKKSQEDFGNAANGVTRFGLTLNGIKSIPMNVPDIPTQRTIADFLDRETARIDKIIERTRISIDRLKEYRSALITAAVTGQINVSTYARSRTTDHQLDAIQSEM